MEVTIAWFWVVKLVLSLLMVFTIYKAIQLKNKPLGVLAIIMILIYLYTY